MTEGQEEIELKEVLAHRLLHKQKGDSGISYLVKWVGCGPAYNSWEPEQMLKRRAPEMLSDYWDEAASVQDQSHDSDTGLAPTVQQRPPAAGGAHACTYVRRVCDKQPSPLPYYTVTVINFMTLACAVPSAYNGYASTPSVISALLARGYTRYNHL